MPVAFTHWNEKKGTSSPLWVLDLLCDKVEGVPSRVGEQSRVQSQSDVSRILRGALEQALEVLRVTWKTTTQTVWLRISFLISVRSFLSRN